MNWIFNIALLTVAICLPLHLTAQITLEDASDPASMISRVTLDVETYAFENNARF
jgi:hypothetical protein